jgi:hypothetical protein
MDIDNLDIYYEDCVIGGPGLLSCRFANVKSSLKQRVRSGAGIAGRQPEAQVMPTSSHVPRILRLVRRMWQERWGGGIDFQ